jgi:hypothetical protein
MNSQFDDGVLSPNTERMANSVHGGLSGISRGKATGKGPKKKKKFGLAGAGGNVSKPKAQKHTKQAGLFTKDKNISKNLSKNRSAVKQCSLRNSIGKSNPKGGEKADRISPTKKVKTVHTKLKLQSSSTQLMAPVEDVQFNFNSVTVPKVSGRPYLFCSNLCYYFHVGDY